MVSAVGEGQEGSNLVKKAGVGGSISMMCIALRDMAFLFRGKLFPDSFFL